MTRHALALVGAIALVLAEPAASDAPTRVPYQLDDTFQSRFLTNRCGVPVVVHIVGTGTITVFYDRNGTIVREFDMLPTGMTSTYSSPIELGGTGKTFSETVHSPVIFIFPAGTDPGDPAFMIVHGVQRTSGPGSPRNVGREVYEAVVAGVDAEGVPIVDVGEPIVQAGQLDVDPVAEARCELLTDP